VGTEADFECFDDDFEEEEEEEERWPFGVFDVDFDICKKVKSQR
jgi:hypothetical protein